MPNTNHHDNHTLIGTSHADWLHADDDITLIDGAGGDDTLVLDRSDSHQDLDLDTSLAAGASGTTLADGTTLRNVENIILATGSGDDRLKVSSAANLFYWDAGDGRDTLSLDYLSQARAITILGGNGGTSVSVTAGHDIAGQARHIEQVSVSGGSGNDLFSDTQGDDTFNGNGGDDFIISRWGADQIDGGAGIDTVELYRRDMTGDLTFSGVAAMGAAGAMLADGTSVKNAEIFHIYAGSGDDHLGGGARADILSGGSGDDTLSGGGGNDILIGGSGADVMMGGSGDDRFYVDSTNDKVVEAAGAGNDTIYASVSYSLAGTHAETLILQGNAVSGSGSADADKIVGDARDNQLSGGGGDDWLEGQWGNDLLNGGSGADHMAGGLGDDTYIVDNTGDVVTELSGGGGDRVESFISYTLGANLEHLTLLGSANLDATGNGLGNAIDGNSGDNVIRGMGGNDVLTGGAGADTFVFEAAGSGDLDRITDFQSGVDHLAFTGADYGFAAGHVLASAELTLGSVAAGALAQFVFDASTHTLWWDADGSGSGHAVVLAILEGQASLHAGDFLFT